ncbi:mycofactocin biosynthesis glycosyltransferase MftF [Gordonia crocea]|uniref:Putative glycosyltransferase n=1 Tax=Gordonia crocea TaxID=589162 RepID=A0A7I9V2J6_9ACTN|nr:mycofactocin biosynthesis glycosyltransferase MftF [Gordonia crocea]GED99391.1 putative glycosyltransferase [Gordonia crocea]
MTEPNTVLPSGFQVQIDRRSARGDWTHIVGGSPTRLLRMSARAVSMIDEDGRITVRDNDSGALARKLLDSDVAHPRPMFGPHIDEVTVVIPVRDNQSGIDRLLAALPDDVPVVVVDDGSAVPVHVPEGVVVARFETSRGPAAARNHGAALVESEFVAFLDSDVVPHHTGDPKSASAEQGPCGEWLAALMAHFSDPAVGLVAPRIVGLPVSRPSVVERYEAGFSSLDMGPREASVRPGSRVAYVPSAAMVVRRSAFPGFDEDLRVAEDVDLCWRMSAAGWRLRYDPIVRVAHEHRSTLPALLGRRRFYGTGAALLADRHDRKAAPLAMRIPTALAVVALLTRTRLGLIVAVACAGFAGWTVRQRLGAMPQRERVAAELTAASVGHGLIQAGGAVCRHYWPVALIAALLSGRLRLLWLQMAVADALVAWLRTAFAERRIPDVDPMSFFVLRRLDDLAYGTGLWQGALRDHDATALMPVLA